MYRYCPSCRAEYRPGFTECADCGIELVDDLPEELGTPTPDRVDDAGFRPEDVPELVEAYRTDRLDAEVVRSLLEGNGIPAMVSREGFSSAYPLTVGDLGAGRVLVPREHLQTARELIESASQGGLELAADETDGSEGGAMRAWDRVPVAVKGIIALAFILLLLLGGPLI